MKNPELYHKTVDILVQDYFNDTLIHGQCTACAIGNIVAVSNSYKMAIVYENDGSPMFFWHDAEGDEVRGHWSAIHSVFSGQQSPSPFDFNKDEGMKQIMSTGYNAEDTAKIEWAFEMAPKGDSDDEWMFNGLMAVVEVLDIIHDNTDAEVTTTSKSRFNKQLA